MIMMKARLQAVAGRIGRIGLASGALLATHAALAVNSLPGGPGVNAFDLPAAVTGVAADQKWLHYFMLWICTIIFLGGFGGVFFSIFKHPTPNGAKPANLPERATA